MPSRNPQPFRGSCSGRPRTVAWPVSGTPRAAAVAPDAGRGRAEGRGPLASPGCPGPARARNLPAEPPSSHPPCWLSPAQTTEAGGGGSLLK